MIINKDGKLFGKVSIIDIIVVLAVIVVAFGIYSKFVKPNAKISTTSQHIEYTLKVKEVRINTVDALKKLGPISDSKTKEDMGKIADVSYVPATYEVEKEDGSIVKAEVSDRYDVYVTVDVDGKINNNGYYTSQNKPLAVGSTFTIASKFVITQAEISDIKEVK